MRFRPGYPRYFGNASWLAALTLTAATSALTACMVEAPSDDGSGKKQLLRPGADHGSRDPAGCRFELGQGCLDGHVDARQQFFVEGKEFFDANDLAAHFGALLHVQAGGKDITAGGANGYKLTLATPLDDDSFVTGFGFDLSDQDVVRSGETRTDGAFAIDDLPPGSYNLRVLKSIKFTLAPPDAASPTAPGATPTPTNPTPVTPPATPQIAAADGTVKDYCATLYEDQSVNVRESQQAAEMLSNFRLRLSSGDCDSGEGQTTINL